MAPSPVSLARVPEAKTENHLNVSVAFREKGPASDEQVRPDGREQDKEPPRTDSGWKPSRSADIQSSGANPDAIPTPITQQASFEALLNHALGETFSSEASPVRNTKPGLPTAPDPKRDPQGRSNEAAVPELAKAPLHDPLPLMISLSLATPRGLVAQRNTSSGQQGSSIEIPAVDSKEEAAPKLTLSPETAFTARVKISDQVPFAIPQGEPNAGNTPVRATAAEPDAAKSAADKASAVDARAVEASVVEASSGQPNQAPQAVLTPAVNAGAPAAISKEAPVVKTANPIAEVPATPVGATSPMKEISLQLPGTRGVEVKLTETAGQVRVDVRSMDSALTQDLRGNLHELVNSLEKRGLSAEVSHPVQAGGVRLNESGASKEANSESNGDATGRHEQERQQQQRQRQQNPLFDGRSQKVRATAWNDAIDSHLEKR